MRHRTWLVSSAIAVALAGSASSSPNASDDSILGIWCGTARCADDETELCLRFARDEGGKLTVLFDLPATNVIGAPLGAVAEKDRVFEFFPCRVELDPAGERLHGSFSYQGAELRLELAKTERVPTASKSSDAASSARPAWTFATEAAVWGSPAFDGARVYIGGNDGRVHALDAKTGKPAWSFQTGGAVVARPTIAGARVLVPSDSGSLFALDRASGAELWRRELHSASFQREWPNNGQGAYDYFASAATVDDGVIFVGSADGRLLALDERDGAVRWSFATGAPIRSTPIVAHGKVVFGGRDHFVYALERDGGKLAWKRDTLAPVVSSPAIHESVVVIGSRSANLFALDVDDGEERWRHYMWLSWVESSAVARDNDLFVGSSDYQRLTALDARTGKARWRFDTDGSAWSTPAVDGDAVFIGAVGTVGYMADHRGGFFAVERATGKERWRLSMPPLAGSFAYGVASSPAVGAGLVYFGALDGKVYALPTR